MKNKLIKTILISSIYLGLSTSAFAHKYDVPDTTNMTEEQKVEARKNYYENLKDPEFRKYNNINEAQAEGFNKAYEKARMHERNKLQAMEEVKRLEALQRSQHTIKTQRDLGPQIIDYIIRIKGGTPTDVANYLTAEHPEYVKLKNQFMKEFYEKYGGKSEKRKRKKKY